jgi:hypothetical protein
MVRPSTRETWLDKTIKTGGALLPLIRRNKTVFSVLTQPFAQAYIAGHQTYSTHERYKIVKTFLAIIGGFFYGTGLGVRDALSSIPLTIYTGLFASILQQQKANHALAISSAPANEPGLRVQAIMDIRDHLLQLMATANGHEPSREQLINHLLSYVKKMHPSLLSGRAAKEEHYKEILLKTFPLGISAWKQLFEPVIDASSDSVLQNMINKYALQIDSVFVYVLYECLTAPNGEQAIDELIKMVSDKHKLNDLQKNAVSAFVHYYANDPEAKRQNIALYRFNGSALTKLKEKEQGLRKIQIWMNHALDRQWGVETLFACFRDQYRIQLNQFTLADIVFELPDSMKEALQELLSHPGNERKILHYYQFDDPQKAFLIECALCYQKISDKKNKDIIVERVRISEANDSSLSSKAREHLKLTQFIQREWHHQLLGMDSAQSIIKEIKKQVKLPLHSDIDALLPLYEAVIKNPKSVEVIDAFYDAAEKIQMDYGIESPLHEWLNVTMNVFLNLLLDEHTWANEKKLSNPLSDSQAAVKWLHHLITQRHGVRALLTQQSEQADSFDQAAWRCQYILRALEEGQIKQEYIRNAGMQKLLRIICQNNNTLTATGEQQARAVPIRALCSHSITMQHALDRVKEKIPNTDFVRPIDVGVLVQ